ncbi:MAG: tRNA (adenosine(37)-N6)-threonylcarbamoyltransferase complex dimerization subunit type 1 TsaB, partial [Deltaproteobacteria bacterium]|nr:tRNA (adenosine(37)-N6)-threonylcarbamoyltransferase complex dimerization subunit type 1 TsaB [Deltaproteobacteria bacterium]
MLILAFDTSSPHASASLSRAGRELCSARGQGRAKHGDTLLPLVRQVLREADVRATELELLVVGTGPGSFTGLRVGLALAKGLALGLGCPLVGVPSPVALARAAAPAGGLVATVTRAYRGEVYASLERVE